MYGKVRCNHSSNFIWEDTLIDYIKNKLDSLVKNNYRKLKEKLKEQNKIDDNKILVDELESIIKQIKKYTILSNKLLESYTNSIINENQYRLQNKSIGDNLDNLVKRKEKIEGKLNKKDNSKEEEKELIGGIDDLLDTPIDKWNNSMMKSIIEKIVIYIDGTICIDFKYIKSM